MNLATRVLRSRTSLILAIAMLPALAGCRDEQSAAPREPEPTSIRAAPQPTTARLHAVDISTLPRLTGDDARGLPARIPSMDADLPSLLEDLPGRAVMVVNPEITLYPWPTWSELDVLVYGVDGRWRRLNLGDLGLDKSLRYYDTFASGSLSTDGRWWTAPTRGGSLLLNMRTGAVKLLSIDPGVWVQGRNAILTRGVVTSIPDGKRTKVPYDFGNVGFEPDGTPLSLERGPDGEALLVEWRGRSRTIRTEVVGLNPPPQRLSGRRRSDGMILPAQLSSVVATNGMVANSQFRGRDGLAIIAVDSATGQKIGEVTWKRSTGRGDQYRAGDFDLYYDDWWLDHETLLIAARPYFLAWRPRTGEVFRVTDARSVPNGYWEPTIAPQVIDR